MNPRIETWGERRLVGCRLAMSHADFRVAELWRSFAPRRGEIARARGRELVSMAVYGPGHFAPWSPARVFDKWAAVEVEDFERIPAGMEAFVVAAGLWAVVDHVGSSDDAGIFREILGTWLPASAWELDDRPHLEILGERYANRDPTSQEQIWIPIRVRR